MGKVRCLFPLRIQLESVWGNSPVSRALPQEGALSPSAGHAFPVEEDFSICSHPGFAELLGTQGKVLVQEERALAALPVRLQHSSAWGQSWIQSQLQRMYLFGFFFYFMQREKKSRQKDCNSRSVPPECVTGEMMMYAVPAPTLLPTIFKQEQGWLPADEDNCHSQ